MAIERRERVCMNRTVSQSVIKRAIGLLTDYQWSPQQISAYLKAKGEKISHETIYAYIRMHPELHVHCRHKMKYRLHIKRPKATKATNIPNRVSIHARPPQADVSRFGDRELDLIVGAGQKSCLVTLVERSKSYVLIKRLETKHHTAVKQAIIQMLFPFRKTHALKTITLTTARSFITIRSLPRLYVRVYILSTLMPRGKKELSKMPTNSSGSISLKALISDLYLTTM